MKTNPLHQQIKGKELTQSQLLIWSGQQLHPNVPLYNSPFIFEFNSVIEEHSFQSAFQKLIDQTDALRTIFVDVKGIPQQIVLPQLALLLKILDWSEKKINTTEVETWAMEKGQQMLDISQQCFQSFLIKISNEKYVWYINQHHLITDGWSITVLFKQMMKLYQSALTNELQAVDTLPQFRDYQQFERSFVESDKGRQNQNFWNDKVADAPAPPRLYGQINSTAITASTRIRMSLGMERSNRLRELAADPKLRHFTKDLTLFNFFTTLTYAYVFRVSNQAQIAIGVPTHNRTTPDFKKTVGLFIELFPLIARIEEEETFATLLKKARTAGNVFMTNAKQGSSSAAMSKGFNVILNYINTGFDAVEGIPTKTKWLHPNHIDPSHHLRLEVHDFDQNGNFQIDFDFNSGAILEDQQDKAIQHFTKLLDAFLADPYQSVAAVDLLSENEKQQLLSFGNANQPFEKPNKTILDVFQEQVNKRKSETAVVFENESIAYLELDQKSNQLAHFLQKKGVVPQSYVGIFMERSVDLIVGILGILKAGAAYLPLDDSYPKERLIYMLDDSETSVVLTQHTLANKIDDFKGQVILFDKQAELIHQEHTTPLSTSIRPNGLAYLLYTSGSTGRPKGSKVTHGNVTELVKNLYQSIYRSYSERLKVALVAPVVFDPSVQQIFGALLQGHTLYIVPDCDRKDGVRLQRFFAKNNIQISDGTPAHLRLLMQSTDVSYLPKHLIIGGEAMSAVLIKRFKKHFKWTTTTITNIYGVAECCVDSTAFHIPLNDPITSTSEMPIGQPLTTERVYILNKKNQIQPIGTPGELCIGGNGIGQGYHQLDELTEARFVPDPFVQGEQIYKTGDLAKFLPDGNIQFLGRQDKQVKVRGYRIELGEIEHQLRAFKKKNEAPLIFDMPLPNVKRCKKCLLSEHHPKTTFDENGICNTCNKFDVFKEQSTQYFKTITDLENLMVRAKENKKSEYDCMLLYSGGKDSSYVLYRLVEMGLKVLAFTFDNGFISKAAFENIKRQTTKLGVESIIRQTERMDDIFIESLQSDSTVCSGCFKSLTAISTLLAEEKGINVIFTGLSRGQIFDTKLAGLYQQGIFEVNEIERQLMLFRQMFHAAQDRTNQLLELDLSNVPFEKMHFIDFFRYDTVSVPNIRAYLKTRDSFWQQPKDTGFCSSNCLMNDIGICVHSQNKGYHNYEAPLSWDVRLGVSTREEVLPEVQAPVNEKQVKQVLKRIGFFEKEIKEAFVVDRKDEHGDTYLCAYFIANHQLTITEIRSYLTEVLPKYMIPAHFIQIEKTPLTSHGKVDYSALPLPDASRPNMEVGYVAPQTEFEEILSDIWSSVLQKEEIGIHDNFLEIGGNSLSAIRIMARANEAFELDISLNKIFELMTIAKLGKHIEEVITELLEQVEE